MSQTRLLLLVVGAGVLLLGTLPAVAGPAGAAERGTAVPGTGPGPSGPAVPFAPAAGASAAGAMALLAQAARAARVRTWSGRAYVASWHDGVASVDAVDVSHEPLVGTWVGAAGPGSRPAVTPAPGPMDGHLLELVGSHYRAAVTAQALCGDRPTDVVEVRRPDGVIAARFALDRATHLPLRREAFDRQGRATRTSSLVDVAIGVDAPAVDDLSARAQSALDLAGGYPRDLPGGFSLFRVQQSGQGAARVLHLAYSDGLRTVSVFSQSGGLSGSVGDGFTAVAGSAVQRHAGPPERLVWSADGRVLTLVADVGDDEMMAMVRALPHGGSGGHAGLSRLRRGLARVGSWLPAL